MLSRADRGQIAGGWGGQSLRGVRALMGVSESEGGSEPEGGQSTDRGQRYGLPLSISMILRILR